MFTVYVLLSEKDLKRYIGVTNNLQRRLCEHNAGRVKSTRNRRPFVLVYSESIISKEEAYAREQFFKSGKGREYLKQKLNL